jgi:hypothetical protein
MPSLGRHTRSSFTRAEHLGLNIQSTYPPFFSFTQQGLSPSCGPTLSTLLGGKVTPPDHYQWLYNSLAKLSYNTKTPRDGVRTNHFGDLTTKWKALHL